MHGKTSRIRHDEKTIFAGLDNPFVATRYHSLVIQPGTLPDCLEVTARAEDDETEIMGVRHKEALVEGVQFHPESYLTEAGYQLLENFLKLKY
jgi:anthranilate synthase/aminodeoxychorismate synthase-like glutamine amidotransferase